MALDKGLQGNETIEEAILALQEQTSQEMLAHALTVVRRRMKEGGLCRAQMAGAGGWHLPALKRK